MMQIYPTLILQHKGEIRQEEHSRICVASFLSVYFPTLGPNVVILDLVPWPVEQTMSSRAIISSLWVSAVGDVLKRTNPMDMVLYLEACTAV